MKRPSFLRKWDGFRLQSKASISPPTILLVSDIIEMSPAFWGATKWGQNFSENAFDYSLHYNFKRFERYTNKSMIVPETLTETIE